jgi:hypothetical protein
MPIEAKDSDFWLVPLDTDLGIVKDEATGKMVGDYDKVVAAITDAGTRIGRVKTAGAIGGSRNIANNEYLSKDPSEKVYGAATYPNFPITCPFENEGDNLGLDELSKMFNKMERRMMIIENTNGSYLALPVMCAGTPKEYATGEFIMVTATVEQDGPEAEIVDAVVIP